MKSRSRSRKRGGILRSRSRKRGGKRSRSRKRGRKSRSGSRKGGSRRKKGRSKRRGRKASRSRSRKRGRSGSRKRSRPIQKLVASTKPPSTTTKKVMHAITYLKNGSKGTSTHGIKKYLATNFNMDTTKHAPTIRKAILAGVANGAIVQVKGKGASGSFRLSNKGRASRVSPTKKSPNKKLAKAISAQCSRGQVSPPLEKSDSD